MKNKRKRSRGEKSTRNVSEGLYEFIDLTQGRKYQLIILGGNIMKKKIAVVGMALAILFSMAACSQTDASKPSNDNQEKVTSEAPAEKPADTPAEEVDIAWPERPIQFVVGANPGGGIDTAARLMAKHLKEELDSTIAISNIAGGAGSVAARQVKDSKADGYTALVCHDALLSNKISGTTEFDYDGFAAGGVGLQVFSTALLSKEYTTFQELVEAAKKDVGKIKFGTEIATNDTAVISMIEDEMDVQFQIVDTGAVSDQTAAMMGQHIDFMKAPVGLVKDYVESGEFHVLAFFNEERNEDYPEIPTMKELGIDFIVDKFYFVGFPLGTDDAIISKFSTALKKVVESPAFIEEAKAIDYDAAYISPEDIPEYFEKAKTRMVEYQALIDERAY